MCDFARSFDWAAIGSSEKGIAIIPQACKNMSTGAGKTQFASIESEMNFEDLRMDLP